MVCKEGGVAGRNKKEEVPGFHLPTPQLFKINIKVNSPSDLILQCHNSPPHIKTIEKEKSNWKRTEEVKRCKGKYVEELQDEEVQECRCLRVPRSRGPKVPNDQDISNHIQIRA